MDITTKIRMLAAAKEMPLSAIAESVGMSKQNFSNKLRRGTLRCKDLERIAEVCDAELGFMINGEKFI